jgi:hypothetical protein
MQKSGDFTTCNKKCPYTCTHLNKKQLNTEDKTEEFDISIDIDR